MGVLKETLEFESEDRESEEVVEEEREKLKLRSGIIKFEYFVHLLNLIHKQKEGELMKGKREINRQ